MRDWFDLAIAERYPQLRFAIRDNKRALVGLFPVRLPDNSLVDQFTVEVLVPEDLDAALPVVREIGGRIPRNKDRHCNETDGTLCIFLPEARFIYFPKGKKLLEYLDGPLNSFLFCQSRFEAKRDWSFGDSRHGVEGRIDFYRERFALDGHSGSIVLTLLQAVVSGSARRSEPCPCGSGKKTKQCHWMRMCELTYLVDNSILVIATKEMNDFFRKTSINNSNS